MSKPDVSDHAAWFERNVREELWNINKNAPVWPGDTISHRTANECVRRGWARRDRDGYFVPENWPETKGDSSDG